MDFYNQQLAALELEIKDVVKKQTCLQKKVQQGTITDEEEIELAGIDKLLEKLRASAKRYVSFIKLAIMEPPVFKSFSDADEEWIEAVTGVDTSYRRWTSYVVDDSILPRPGFLTAFMEVFQGFEGCLRLFPQLELSVTESNGVEERKLGGRTDYTIGFGKGKDILSKAIPREVHLVAVEAKTSIGLLDMLQCVAEAATLYKIRVDARKPKKSVWGILSNAETWKFIFIDEAGLLWKSDAYFMPLDCYDESKVLQVYRMVYHMIKCCHEACTPPTSTVLSVESLSRLKV
ncbi:hypothetical protein MP228_002791 [Amoeboaphelidium protococcarum]|nr:hypothetical protein MP228_002791 [Amoeboaphelidium protococcarum]